MFDQFILLKDLVSPELEVILDQNELYAKVNLSDISSLPEINLDNFVNICNFVDYYQLIDDSEFIANIQYHILNNTKEIINSMYSIPLNMQHKIYDHECILNMQCKYNEVRDYNQTLQFSYGIKHICCYKFLNQNNDISYDIDSASRTGGLELVKYLFKIGKTCTTNAIDFASIGGYLDIVKYLFEVQNQNCTKSAVSSASYNGHLEVVKYLLEVQHIECYCDIIKSPCESGHLDVIKYLYETKAYKNSIERMINIFKPHDCTHILQEMDGNALCMAGSYGYYDIVDYLFDVKNIRCPDIIERLCSRGHLDMVKYLLDVKRLDCPPRSLNYACGSYNLKLVEYLFDVKKLDCTQFGIELACRYGCLEVVRYLCEIKHKDINQQCVDGASKNGYLEVVKYLIESQNKKYTQLTKDIARPNVLEYLLTKPDSFIEEKTE